MAASWPRRRCRLRTDAALWVLPPAASLLPPRRRSRRAWWPRGQTPCPRVGKLDLPEPPPVPFRTLASAPRSCLPLPSALRVVAGSRLLRAGCSLSRLPGWSPPQRAAAILPRLQGWRHFFLDGRVPFMPFIEKSLHSTKCPYCGNLACSATPSSSCCAASP